MAVAGVQAHGGVGPEGGDPALSLLPPAASVAVGRGDGSPDGAVELMMAEARSLMDGLAGATAQAQGAQKPSRFCTCGYGVPLPRSGRCGCCGWRW